MHISRKITLFTVFAAINLAIAGVFETEPFETMLSLASPFNEDLGKYNLALLTLTIVINVVFISSFIELIAEQLKMCTYVLTRTNRKKSINFSLKRTVINALVIWGYKIGTDCLFAQIRDMVNVFKAFSIMLSTLVTSIIWILVIYILFGLHLKAKWVYFIMIIGMIFFQYTSAYIQFSSVFVFGSPYILEMPVLWIVLKILCALILLFFSLNMYESYEYLNDLNEP